MILLSLASWLTGSVKVLSLTSVEFCLLLHGGRILGVLYIYGCIFVCQTINNKATAATVISHLRISNNGELKEL